MTSSWVMHRLSGYRRGGSMYVAVLGCSMMITVLGLSALTLARVERTSALGTADLTAARFYAQSAIEMGQHYIRQDSKWRETYPSGAWEADRLIGTGKYTLEGIDPADGILSNSPSDPLLLRGTGFEGESRYKLQVTMVSKSKPLTCLEVAMHAGTDLNFDSAIVQSKFVTISANSDVNASDSIIFPNVEFANSSSGGTFDSGLTGGMTPRTMPSLAVFDHYVLNGTPILYATLALLHGGEIRETVLSPNSNPYGLTNSNGIYVINCLGGDLRIRSARIVGTLVILNPGNFEVDDSINWEPAIANYPSLLVLGKANLEFSNGTLKESDHNVNFNPPGTPYGGGGDADKLDSYPSKITGLVYVSGDVSTRNYVTLDGAFVIGATLDAKDNLNLTYRSTFYDNPPPGFGEAPEMVISPGTWKQLVD